MTGQGTVTQLRFEDESTDLALAYVNGPLANECGNPWTQLDGDLSRVFRGNSQATLITIARSGMQVNIPLRVQGVMYEHIMLEAFDKENYPEIGQGKSGSLVTINDIPVGIALRAAEGANQDQIRALRMDAVKNRLDRFIAGSDLATHTSKTENQATSAKLDYEVAHWNKLPLTPESGPDNLTKANGVYTTDKLSSTLEIDLKLLGEQASTVKKVVINSNTNDDRYTSPKKIVLMASNRADKSRVRKLVGAENEMSIDGVFTARVNTKLRWLLIRVHSVWDSNKPLRIDSVLIE